MHNARRRTEHDFCRVWANAQKTRACFFRSQILRALSQNIDGVEQRSRHMSLPGRRSKKSFRVSLPSESSLRLVIAAVYILVHVVVGAMLIHATIDVLNAGQHQEATSQ